VANECLAVLLTIINLKKIVVVDTNLHVNFENEITVIIHGGNYGMYHFMWMNHLCASLVLQMLGNQQ